MNAIQTGRMVAGCLLQCALLLLGGCAVTPETRQSLAGYVQAMDQVEQSADMFVSDFASSQKVQEELNRLAGVTQAARRPEYPEAFVLLSATAAPQTDFDKAVASTRLALAAVSAYNDALVALAEGQSEQEVRQRASGLGGALQTFASFAGQTIPGVDLLVGVGAKIIKLAQDASNRQQLQQAVAQGREPVGQILSALEQQTPSMYAASVRVTSRAQDVPQDNISRSAAALKSLLERRGPPADEALATQIRAAQDQLIEIGMKTRTLKRMPLPFPLASGRPVYDAATQTEVQVFVHSMDTSAQRYVELIAKQNAYHDLMSKYVVALRQSRHSLDLLAESLNRPVDLRAEIPNLLRVAFDLRDAIGAYRHPPVAGTAP